MGSFAVPVALIPTVVPLILAVMGAFSLPTIKVLSKPDVTEELPFGSKTFSIFVPAIIPNGAPWASP